MFKKMRTKLTVIMGILLVFMLVINQSLTYFYMKKNMESEIITQGKGTVEQLEHNFEVYFNDYKKNIERYSVDHRIISFINNNDGKVLLDIDQDFSTFLQTNSDVSMIYFGTSDKSMFDMPKKDRTGYDPTERPWYQKALAYPDQVVWTEPYIGHSNQQLMITAAKTIRVDNEIKGVIGIDILLETLSQLVNEINVSHNGSIFLLDQDGSPLIYTDNEGKDLSEKEHITKLYEDDSGKISYVSGNEERILYFVTIPNLGWKIFIDYNQEDLFARLNNALFLSMIIGGIAILMTIGVIYVAARSISTPIVSLREQVEMVSSGNLSNNTTVRAKDEVGDLALHFNKMIINMRNIIFNVKSVLTRVIRSSERLQKISKEMMGTSEQIAVAIEEVAQGVSQQAVDTEKMNDKTIQLSDKINQVHHSINEIKELSMKSTDASNEGLQSLENLQLKSNLSNREFSSVESVLVKLIEKVKKIELVSQSISEVSEQTNLLALNASIEAARAGESGKGFAVVAREVRNLAKKSAKETSEIHGIISAIQVESDHATNAMSKAIAISHEQQVAVSHSCDSFKNITFMMNQLIESINHIVIEIQQMHENKDVVNDSITSISAISQQSAATTEEVNASTDDQLVYIRSVSKSVQELNQACFQLEELISQFKLED
ncbi:methyl-accepting chemotaxis protein [Chengkuizengella marina]|uniref:Methyl-accepting chemotaxis protein n=1 Tax=Chengkuizengella marina TaxID=2507566 RepID=A0A6N9Q595_9BACL|nr:methyl-accepting chemotaxis protein [Chengkuizengella marina]NBI29940.1 methyl-accepting chemotaxis protein [Chengkuizengella marina]